MGAGGWGQRGWELLRGITWIRGLQALSGKEEGEGTTARKERVGFIEQAAPTKETQGQVFQWIPHGMSQFEPDCR